MCFKLNLRTRKPDSLGLGSETDLDIAIGLELLYKKDFIQHFTINIQNIELEIDLRANAK